MLGELIWGQSFIDEMSKPHSDPEIRKMEERVAEITRQMVLAYFFPEPAPIRDCLPVHYRKIKIKGERR
jgi:hypothetical protein